MLYDTTIMEQKMRTIELEKSIERIKKIEPVEIKKISLDGIAAIGTGSKILRFLTEKERWEEIIALDESKRMHILELYTNPLISKEDYINLVAREQKEQKIKLITKYGIALASKIECKTPKNFIWKIKNFLGTYELDKNNISYSILNNSFGGEWETDIWADYKVIPVYQDNQDYNKIIKFCQEIRSR